MLSPSSFVCQTVTEKHKLNVPETMTEILDVSDEEGDNYYDAFFFFFFHLNID